MVVTTLPIVLLRLVLGTMTERPPVLVSVRMCPLPVAVDPHTHLVIGRELMKETVGILPRLTRSPIILRVLRMTPNILVGRFVLANSLVRWPVRTGASLDGPKMNAPLYVTVSGNT